MSQSPANPRAPDTFDGWAIVAVTLLSTVAASYLSPLLPTITEHFRGVANLDVKISLLATIPALFVAVLAAPAGMLGDRLGHRSLLFWAVLLYGVAGVAPRFLASLESIVATRAVVGIAEAVIMTSANALLASYFVGANRQRWLAVQTAAAPVSAMVLLALGGLFGRGNWQNAFLLYGVAFLMVPLVLRLLPVAPVQRGAFTTAVEEPFNVKRLIVICLITLFGSTAFFITIIQFGFLANLRGVADPAVIGLWSALSAAGNPLGAITFGFWRAPLHRKLALSLTLLAIGFAVMTLGSTFGSLVAGAAIANFGAGMFLPTAITWALSTLPPSRRGVGVGAWNSAFFFGQFASPLIMIFLRDRLGSLFAAIAVYAVLMAIGAIVAVTLGKGRVEAN
jgi:MFS family permease